MLILIELNLASRMYIQLYENAKHLLQEKTTEVLKVYLWSSVMHFSIGRFLINVNDYGAIHNEVLNGFDHEVQSLCCSSCSCNSGEIDYASTIKLPALPTPSTEPSLTPLRHQACSQFISA